MEGLITTVLDFKNHEILKPLRRNGLPGVVQSDLGYWSELSGRQRWSADAPEVSVVSHKYRGKKKQTWEPLRRNGSRVFSYLPKQ